MYSCLGKRAQAAEVSWGREAMPFWFSPAGKSKTASLLNLTVVQSKKRLWPLWMDKKKLIKVNNVLSNTATCEMWGFLKKKIHREWKVEKENNLLVGRYIHVI